MGKLITAIFGAGIFGSIISMRKYFGIVLVMVVSTMIFKADIVDYMKQSSKQQHEEKLAQINFETERLKIEAEAKAQADTKAKAEYDRVQAEILQKDKEQKQIKEKLEQDKRNREKAASDAAILKSKVKAKMCGDFFTEYTKILNCAMNSSNAQQCAQGYSTAVWYNGANLKRNEASNNGCPVNNPEWKD